MTTVSDSSNIRVRYSYSGAGWSVRTIDPAKTEPKKDSRRVRPFASALGGAAIICILAGVAGFSQRAPQPEGRPLGREDFAFSSPGIQTEAIESNQEPIVVSPIPAPVASVDPSAPATRLLPVSRPVKEAVHSLPATPHDLGPGGGISEHDRVVIARNLLSLAELPRPLEASIAAPVERGEGNAVDESAARPADEEASSASPSPSTAVTTAREAGLHFGEPGTPGRLAAGRYSGSGAADRAVPWLTEASDNALDRGMAAAMPPVPSPAPAVPLARPNGSEQASPGRIAEAQRLLTRLGYAPGAADGVLGKRTETAIRGFQRRKGATADGEVTDQLVARLRSDVRHLAARPPQAPPVERTGVATAGRSSPGLLASLVHGFQRLIGWDSDSARHPAAFRAYCHTSSGERVYCGNIARRKGAG
jgi:Putative peptidoglycan binding domain